MVCWYADVDGVEQKVPYHGFLVILNFKGPAPVSLGCHTSFCSRLNVSDRITNRVPSRLPVITVEKVPDEIYIPYSDSKRTRPNLGLVHYVVGVLVGIPPVSRTAYSRAIAEMIFLKVERLSTRVDFILLVKA